MKSSRRTFLVTTLRVAGGLALAACASAPTAAPSPSAAAIKRGGQLAFADSSDPKSMDPAFITNRQGARVLQMMYDPLIDLDSESKLVPALAESWDISADAKTVTLKLRQGVKFHDGTTFDAQAVKAHFDRHLDPASKSLRTGELAGVAGVDAVDSGTVRIRLKDPNPQFLYFLIDWNAFIESPTALQRYGADYGAHPAGTGPFKFVEYAKDDHTLMERNPDYWDKGRPYVDSLRFRVIPTDATRLIELQSGGVQFAQDPPFQDVQRLSAMTDVKLARRLGGRFSIWFWNIGHSPYADSTEFRQAVNWALDREGILRGIFFGSGRLSFAPFHVGTPFDDPSYRPFTRDLTKAKQLLETAQRKGLPSPARFPIYTGPAGVYPKLIQIVQSNLADIGVTVDIQQENDAAYTARTDRNDWHWFIYSGSWSWRPDPSQYLRNLFHSKSTYTLARVYKDAEIDRLIEQGEQEFSVEKRKTLYRQLADRLNEFGSSVFAYQDENFVALSPKVGGWLFRADGKHHFQNMWLE
jgi:peptide/nickel transport system substrate-binding protein